MLLVLVNIDADFREPYVFHCFGNVNGINTMVAGVHMAQNDGFRRFSVYNVARTLVLQP